MTNVLTWLVVGASILGGSTVMSGQIDLQGAVAQAATPPTQASVLTTTRGIDGRLYTTVRINGHDIDAMVDTAASHSVLSAMDAARVGVVTTGSTRMRSASGYAVVREGRAATLQVAGRTLSEHRLLVTDTVPVTLLGMDVLREMGGISLTL